jgi:hypothetical protein
MLQVVFIQPENSSALTVVCEAFEMSMTAFLRRLFEYITISLYIVWVS